MKIETIKQIFDRCAKQFTERENEKQMSFSDFEDATSSLVYNKQNQIEYWKKRCELAEKYIEKIFHNQDYYECDIFNEWEDFKNSAKAGIEPEEESFKINGKTWKEMIESITPNHQKAAKAKYELIKALESMPEENILSFGINEIKALDAYVSTMRSAMNKVGELTPGRSQDFDILFMHINNLKMLAGITEENNFKSRFNYDPSQEPTIKGFHSESKFTVQDFPSMPIPHPMHDNFRAKYPLVDDINEPITEEQKEKAIRYGDIKLDAMGGSIGYRVHEKDFENEQKFRKARENSVPKYSQIPDRLHEPDEAEQIREIIKENFSYINLDEKSEAANGKFTTPKMSFSDFAKAYFPDNEISVHHKAIIEKLEEVAGTPNHLIMQGVRPINWYKTLAVMHETVIKLKEGKKCSVAMFGKGNYIKQMKEFFDVDVELEEICDNIYSIRLIKKEE